MIRSYTSDALSLSFFKGHIKRRRLKYKFNRLQMTEAEQTPEKTFPCKSPFSSIWSKVGIGIQQLYVEQSSELKIAASFAISCRKTAW